jgi:chemotaxis signal transduction protein
MNSRGVLLVRTEGRLLGLRLGDVAEVGDVGPVQPVPATIPALRGVTTVRGRLVPLFHLGALVGERRCPSGAPAGTMVLAQVAERWIALEVEEADAAPEEEILTTFMDSGAGSWTLGAVRRADGWVPILNLEALAERWRALERVS